MISCSASRVRMSSYLREHAQHRPENNQAPEKNGTVQVAVDGKTLRGAVPLSTAPGSTGSPH